MFIKSISDADMMVGGRPYRDRVGHANTYSTAFPFDRCAPGGVSGPVALVSIHGSNPTVTTAADLWAQNTVRTLPTAGFTIGVSSSSTADVNTSGTGAWIVEVDFLDTSYIPHTIQVALNGRTKVVDTTQVLTALRINDIRVTAVGTGLTNAGAIYVYDQTDTVTNGVPQTATKIFGEILTGDNIARGGFYTVPAACQLQTQQLQAGIDDTTTTARAATITLSAFRLVSAKRVRTDFPLIGQVVSPGGMMTMTPDFPMIFDEKTDLTISAAASGAAVIAAYLDAVLFYKD